MKYLKSEPFSVAVSPGNMTDRQYDIAVGNLVWCFRCEKFSEPDLHKCEGE